MSIDSPWVVAYSIKPENCPFEGKEDELIELDPEEPGIDTAIVEIDNTFSQIRVSDYRPRAMPGVVDGSFVLCVIMFSLLIIRIMKTLYMQKSNGLIEYE